MFQNQWFEAVQCVSLQKVPSSPSIESIESVSGESVEVRWSLPKKPGGPILGFNLNLTSSEHIISVTTGGNVFFNTFYPTFHNTTYRYAYTVSTFLYLFILNFNAMYNAFKVCIFNVYYCLCSLWILNHGLGIASTMQFDDIIRCRHKLLLELTVSYTGSQ